MKTSSFIFHYLKAMTAAIIASTLSMSFVSCDEISDEPSHIIDAENEKATKYLLGTWYAEYEATGTTRTYNDPDTTSVNYTFIVDVYNMDLNNKGYWCRYYFNDNSAMPINKKGGKKEGTFKYVAMEGNGAINLYNDSKFYDSWSFKYDEKSIIAKGENNIEYIFSKVDKDVNSSIDHWDNSLNFGRQ